MTAVLLDTGAIIALLDRRERFHQPVSVVLADLEFPLVTCEPVIAEACHLVRHLPGAVEAILGNLGEGLFEIPFLLSRETRHVVQVLRKYADQQMDLADACLVVLAEELGTGDILTLDRDFLLYRWGRNRPFRLLLDLV